MSIVLGASFANAQHYALSVLNAGFNPGEVNTDIEQPSGYLTANLSGYTQILAPGSTGWTSQETIPFSFDFNGSTYTQYYASASGVVTFESSVGTAPSSTNTALPTSEVPSNSICAWGLNLSGANDAIVSKTFGTAPDRQHWIIWASAGASGLTGTNWTYWGVVLEETTNKAYVVDMRTYSSSGGNCALTVGVQYDSTSAVSVGSSVGAQDVTSGGGTSDQSDNSWYMFAPGTQPANDIFNLTVDNSIYHEVNTANNIMGTIMNFGSATITSMEMSYSVDGGTPVSDNLTGLSVASGASYQYTLPTAWTPTSEATYTITTDVVTINGGTDGDASNNEASMDILVHPTPVPRKPLLEQFTSSTCPPCQPGNVVVNGVLANYSGEYSKLNYQMSWPGTGDPYFTDEGGERRTFYAVTGVPDMRTDGDEGMNSNSFTAAHFEAAQDVPAFVNLTIEATLQQEAEYEVQNGALVKIDSTYHVSASVKMNPIVDMPAGLTAHITIQENITYDNEKTNGETEFHDVMKKMLPDASGTTLAAIAANDSFSFSESHTFMGDYRLSNDAGDPIDHTIEHSVEEWNDLHAVTWIQNDNTNEVWQSENTEVVMLDEISNVTTEVVDGVTITTVGGVEYETLPNGNLAPLGVEDVAGANFSMYPNPANDVITITGLVGNAKVSIYDATGRLVRTESGNAGTLNVSDLEAGVYNITVENRGAVQMEKVTIVH